MKLGETNELIEFVTLLMGAKTDDRNAYDKLLEIDNNHQFDRIAKDTIIQIRTDYNGAFNRGHANVDWKGRDLHSITIEEFRKYIDMADRVFKADLVIATYNSNSISVKDKMELYIDLLKSCDSLSAVDYAAKYFVKLSLDPSLAWSPFHIEPLLKWWDENNMRLEINNPRS